MTAWLRCNLLHLKCASWWVHAYGQDIDHYYEHLLRDGLADGLEVLLVSLALNTPVNIILDDIVWTMSKQDLDFKNLMVLVAMAGAFACLTPDSLDGHLGDLDTVTTDSVDCKKSKDEVVILSSLIGHSVGGQPLMTTEAGYSDSGSTTDTNPNSEFVKTRVVQKKGQMWKVSPQVCFVYNVAVKLK